MSGLYSLSGSHVYAKFISWFIYCELFDESQIYLTLPKLQGEWVLAFGAMNYGIVFELKPISFEAERVVIIRKWQFRVLVGHARNHATNMNDL